MTARTGRWTTDLLGVFLATAVATATVVVGVEGSALRTALVAPFVVFLPGYALVAAVFPERRGDDDPDDGGPVAAPGAVAEGISHAARVGLSVALSIALLPAVVLLYDFALGGIRVEESLLALASVTVLLTLVALVRRRNLPANERFVLPAATHLVDAVAQPFTPRPRGLSRTSTVRPASRRGLLLNLVLVASVVVFVGSVAVAYATPTGEQQFTELYLVTESGDGEFVAADYPRDVDGGGPPVYAAVANHEGEPTTYTLVATLQRVEETPAGTRVVAERELLRESRTVADGETVRVRHDLGASGASGASGDGRARVQYLLYRGAAPADPSSGTAYRRVHLWVSADGGSEAVSGDGGSGEDA